MKMGYGEKSEMLDFDNTRVQLLNLHSEICRIIIREQSVKSNENSIFSPFSFLILLSILADSTGGKSKWEVINALGKNMEYADLITSLNRLLCIFSQSVFIQNTVEVKNKILNSIELPYKDIMTGRWKASLTASNNIKDDGDFLIQGNSNDDASELFEKKTVFHIANAMDFQSEWERPYKELDIQSMDFRNSDGTVSRVRTLVSEEMTCINDDYYIGVLKKYKDPAYSFMAFLSRNEHLNLLDRDIEEIDFLRLMKCRTDKTVDIYLPEFSCNETLDLRGICEAMGIHTVFTQKARFTPMSTETLMLDSIKQEAHLQVTRNGTKASVVSHMWGAGTGDIRTPPEIWFNRPFFYAIIHNETGIPLFSGRINHLDPIPQGEDRMTREEKLEIIREIVERIEAYIFGENHEKDDDLDHSGRDYQLFMKALKRAPYLNILEMLQFEHDIKGPYLTDGSVSS